jgi:hypothetical protein
MRSTTCQHRCVWVHRVVTATKLGNNMNTSYANYNTCAELQTRTDRLQIGILRCEQHTFVSPDASADATASSASASSPSAGGLLLSSMTRRLRAMGPCFLCSFSQAASSISSMLHPFFHMPLSLGIRHKSQQQPAISPCVHVAVLVQVQITAAVMCMHTACCCHVCCLLVMLYGLCHCVVGL